jgi:fucokinase
MRKRLSARAPVYIALELDGRYPIQASVTRLAEPVFRCIADGAGTAEFRSMNEVLATCPPGSPFAVPRAALQLSGIVRAGESLRAALQRRGGGLEVRTSVDLPMGSGLGTSSILAAAVVAALAKMSGTDLTGYRLSDVVTRLEQAITTGGGWQDQAGGIFPGAKLIHSGPGLKQRLRVHPIGWTPDREREFCQRLVLFLGARQE